jgi:hypothetical protein
MEGGREGKRMMYEEFDGVVDELREGDAHRQADKGTLRQTGEGMDR